MKNKKRTNQQLKEEPGIFISILSANPSADDHLQGQLLMKLLQERRYTNCQEETASHWTIMEIRLSASITVN